MERLHHPPAVRRIVTTTGATRLLVDLDPDDLRRYGAAVAAVAPAVERRLDPAVLTGRTGPGRPADPRGAWDRWLARCAARRGVYVLRADVRRCYRSIGPPAVEAGLRSAEVPSRDVDAVRRVLAATHQAGIDGLPVGPAPSAILANAALAIADDAIRLERVAHRRWVDDVVLVGEPARVRRAAEAWRMALRELGLTEHPGKHAEGPADRVLPVLGAASCGSGAVP